MNTIIKTLAAITLTAGLFVIKNPQEIKNVKREIARYDSLSFYYEVSPAELESMQQDRKFEGFKTKNKKRISKPNSRLFQIKSTKLLVFVLRLPP